MDLSSFQFGAVHCQFQGCSDKNVKKEFKLYLFYYNGNTSYCNLTKIPLIGTNLGISVFSLWEETGLPRENPTAWPGDRTPFRVDAGIKPRPQWWEARVITFASARDSFIKQLIGYSLTKLHKCTNYMYYGSVPWQSIIVSIDVRIKHCNMAV